VPELPEVETVRRGLEQRTRGLPFRHIEVLRQRLLASPADPQTFAQALQGTSVLGWQRRGKYLLATLQHADGRDAGLWGVHLRMTGQFLWLEQEQPACRHTRCRLWTAAGPELRFVDMRSFGQMWWVPPGLPPEAVITGLRRLGPEPFEPGFSSTYLRQKLKGSGRTIKTALLDQALVAGVGNIYADESLFLAGLRPQTLAGQVSEQDCERLRQALVDVLTISIGAGGTTFSDFRDLTGTNGNYGGEAWVYRRAELPCRRCGTPIRRDRLGGRSSHWCPSCQR